MREVKRPVFSFRLNLDNPDHKKAWEILQSVPDGQKSSYLVQVILKDQENNQLEKSIRQAIREELAGVSISGSRESVSKRKKSRPRCWIFSPGLRMHSEKVKSFLVIK
ncbi:MAG: plasmid segregation centromere-binding protein ParR [Lachnospiraceae bacterium]